MTLVNILPKSLEESFICIRFSRSCMGRNTDGEIYWRDVGTLDSFWQSTIDLVSEHPQLVFMTNAGQFAVSILNLSIKILL